MRKGLTSICGVNRNEMIHGGQKEMMIYLKNGRRIESVKHVTERMKNTDMTNQVSKKGGLERKRKWNRAGMDMILHMYQEPVLLGVNGRNDCRHRKGLSEPCDDGLVKEWTHGCVQVARTKGELMCIFCLGLCGFVLDV